MCVLTTVYNYDTQYSIKTVLIIFPLILQTITTAQMMSIGGSLGRLDCFPQLKLGTQTKDHHC